MARTYVMRDKVDGVRKEKTLDNLDDKILEFYSVTDHATHKKTIHLVAKEGRITEANGKRKFYLQFNDSEILKYEKRMLSDSGCPYILPMSFLCEDRITTVWYDHTGYIQLKEYVRTAYCGTSELNVREPIYEAMDILLRILQNLRDAEDYLILPDRISVNPSTIFINPSNASISLAFYPNEMPELTFQERLLKMISKINSWYQNDEVDQYTARFQNMIFEKNLGLEGMISILCTIQRELSYIYCNTSHLRKPAETKDMYTETEDLINEARKHFGLNSFMKGKIADILSKQILNGKHK
mgnify:CR=1 FL=1